MVDLVLLVMILLVAIEVVFMVLNEADFPVLVEVVPLMFTHNVIFMMVLLVPWCWRRWYPGIETVFLMLVKAVLLSCSETVLPLLVVTTLSCQTYVGYRTTHCAG